MFCFFKQQIKKEILKVMLTHIKCWCSMFYLCFIQFILIRFKICLAATNCPKAKSKYRI